MNHRDRMLAAMRGEPVDQLPWAPRMDLWYISQRERGTLPPRFAGLSTAGVADALGVACHAVRADFTIERNPRDFALRGFGIDNHADFPYRVEVDGLPVRFVARDGQYETTITTSHGDVAAVLRLTAEMRRLGNSIPAVVKRPLASASEIDAVAEMFEHLVVIPTPAGYRAFHERIGDRGVAVSHGPIAASPMHSILHDLMDMDAFFYLYADDRGSLARLAESMTPFFEAQLEALSMSEAEAVHWGANYDQDVTWPAFFRDEIVPWARRVGSRLRAAGKLFVSHADGENHGLLMDLPHCAFDVAESVCPAPMTRHSLRELRDGIGPETTIWGGVPSVALLPDSMNALAFDQFMTATFDELGSGRRLILGVSDNVPPDADFDRIDEITAACETWRPPLLTQAG
jgi:hypothetical protein